MKHMYALKIYNKIYFVDGARKIIMTGRKKKKKKLEKRRNEREST